MQRMNHQTLLKLLSNEEAIGSFLNGVTQVSPFDYVFLLSKNQNIFVSLNNEYPFLAFNVDLDLFPKGGVNSGFTTLLKSQLSGRLSNILISENDHIITLVFEHKNHLDLSVIFKVVFELIPRRINAFLLDEKDTILMALNHQNATTKNTRDLSKFAVYQYPLNLNQNFNESIQDYDFYENYVNENRQLIINKNHEKLIRTLKRLIKHNQTLLNNYILDIQKCEVVKDMYIEANLLLEHKPVINGPFVDILSQNIAVDPRYNALKNADILFKKAKKFKASETILTTRIKEVEEEISSLKKALADVLSNEDDSLIKLYYEQFGLIKQSRKKQETSAILPYYIMYNQTRILFGKNAEQNQHLSFKIARKNSTFLHIKNIAGSHIIIEEKNPDKKLLNFACNLALFLAKKNDGEISVCPIANIKKGRHLGEVILKNESVIFLRYDETFTPLFKNSIKRVL